MDNFNTMPFIDLAALYDHDDQLSVRDRIMLYGQLMREPLVQEDIAQSVTQLRAQLKRDRDIRSLRLMRRVFEGSCYENLPQVNAIYDDAHNVHSFNEDVLRVANNIIKTNGCPYFRPFDHPFLNRIEAVGDYQGINLTQLFAAVYNFIIQSPHRPELMRRLGEEMNDAVGLCVTGHICRLVNVLQGFTDDPLVMAEYDYYNAKVCHALNKRIDIMNVNESVREIINTINLDDIPSGTVCKILKGYTMEDWKYVDGKFMIS